MTINKEDCMKSIGTKRAWVCGMLLAVSAACLNSQVAVAQQLPDRIKIGILNAQTGPAAPGDAAATYPVIRLAIKELQERGGLLAGRPVDFIYADSASDPTQVTNEARRLVLREGIHVAIGPSITGLAMAAAPIYAQAKVVSLGVAAASTFTPAVAPYWFVPYYSSKSSMRAIANNLADVLKVKSIAVLTGDGASDKAVLEDLRAALAERGLTISGVQTHETRAQDMTPQLLALRRTNPDILFEQSSVGEDGATMMRNLEEIGWNVPILSTAATFMASIWIKGAGPDVFQKHRTYSITYAAMTACKNDPLGLTPYAKFVARLKASDPENFPRFNLPTTAQLYDSIQLLFAAIDQTKSINGDVLKEWIYKNAPSFPAVSGKMSTQSSTSQFLFGADSLGFVDRPDVKRADGTLPRAGC